MTLRGSLEKPQEREIAYSNVVTQLDEFDPPTKEPIPSSLLDLITSRTEATDHDKVDLSLRTWVLDQVNQKDPYIQDIRLKKIAYLCLTTMGGPSERLNILLSSSTPVDDWIHALPNKIHIKCLVENLGVDPNRTMNYGQRTPLHSTIMRVFPLATQALLEPGASLEIRDGNGDTPLNSAISRIIGDTEKASDPILLRNKIKNAILLLDANADPNKANRDGQTPLDYAKELLSQSALSRR